MTRTTEIIKISICAISIWTSERKLCLIFMMSNCF